MMSAALQRLASQSVWEAENRYGLQVYRGASGLDHACVVVQVSGENMIIAVPFGCIDPVALSTAEAAQFQQTDLGPHTAVEVRLRSDVPGSRALTRKEAITLIEISGRLVSQISDFEDLVTIIRPFATSARGAQLWPFGRDLRSVTLEWLASISGEPRLEAFHTGESEVEEDDPAFQASVTLPTAPAAAAPDRRGAVAPAAAAASGEEGVLSSILSRLDHLVNDNVGFKERLQRLEQPEAPTGRSGPQLFGAAASSGGAELTEAQSRRLDELVGRGPGQLRDQRAAPRLNIQQLGSNLSEMREIRGRATLDEEPELGADAQDREERLLDIVLQNQRLMSQMIERDAKANKAGGANSDPLSIILGGQTSDLDADDPQRAGVSAARGSAARLLYSEGIRSRPAEFYNVTRTLLARARRKETSQLEPSDMLKFFEDQSPLGYSKSLTYFSNLVGVMWETLETGSASSSGATPRESAEQTLEKIRSLVARSAVFIDQSACEGGNQFQLPWLLTGLEEPNWAAVQARANYRQAAGMISKLADPRGIAVCQAYLKELKLVEDRVIAGHTKSQSEAERQKEKEAKEKKAAEQKAAAAARKKGDGKKKGKEQEE